MSGIQNSDVARTPAGDDPATKPLPQLLDSRKCGLGFFQGIRMPYYKRDSDSSLQQQVKKIKEFKFKDGDVLLCAYPKSGAHWLVRVLDMIVSGSTQYRAGHSFDHIMMDLLDLQLVNNLEPPRVLFTHYPFDLLPDEVKGGRIKIVHLYRNPKAVTVSEYFMYKKAKVVATLEESIVRHLDRESAVYGNWFYHTDTVLDFKKRYPDVPLFHLSYEDIKLDTAGWVRKLADFLEVHVSEELCNNIATAVAFSTQKQQEESVSDQYSITHSFAIYRKGEADDWKNHMTVSQSERFDAILREKAATSPIFSRYVS